MNRAKSKSELNAFNEKLRLNGLQDVSKQEMDRMKRIRLAYKLEHERRKKRVVKEVSILVFLIIATLACIATGGFNWLIEVTEMILK
jgi:hypothetical protein